MAIDRPCKATLYVESPGLLISSALKKLVMPREDDIGATTGHAFFGITDKDGKETVYGFHSATARPENAGKTLIEKMPMLLGKKHQGVILDDSKDPYDDKMVYHITQKQYDKIKEFSEKQKENPPMYDIFSSNCVVFSYKALKKAELKLPPQPIFYNPASASLGIRIYEKAQKIKNNLKKITANILARFSSTRKISKDILEGLKKKPTKEAFGVKSVVGTFAKNALTKLRSGSFR